MKIDKELYRKQLLSAISIQGTIVKKSIHFNPTIKNNFENYDKHLLEILEGKCNLTQLKSLTTNFLTFWQESIGVDTEIFWTELKRNSIKFERKDELKFTLEKGRFRRVDQGMSANKYWKYLKELNAIKERFSSSDILIIESIIEKDEQKRLNLLKKCLNKKAIPMSQHLKFGESIAYFSECKLFEKHFSLEEKTELHEIWNNFNV